jgi:hypothetical protein
MKDPRFALSTCAGLDEAACPLELREIVKNIRHCNWVIQFIDYRATTCPQRRVQNGTDSGKELRK